MEGTKTPGISYQQDICRWRIVAWAGIAWEGTVERNCGKIGRKKGELHNRGVFIWKQLMGGREG